MRDLDPTEARRIRLRAQGLVPETDLDPAEVVGRAVALQGQDLPAVLRAIAVRSAPGTTVADVRSAFDAGLLVRGWTMRGTLFATTPRDLSSLLALTAERVERSATTRRRELGLTGTVIARADEVARAALTQRGGARRAELMQAWHDAGIRTEGQRGYHLIALLSSRGLMHWGPFAGTEQLLVPSPPAVDEPHDAAIRRIALSYIATRGPVTTDDLAWWLALPKTPLRSAVEGLRETGDVDEVRVDGRPHLLAGGSAAPADASRLIVLPAFDEWILGYRDRSLVASPDILAALSPGGNGVFRPTVLRDGRVVATWRRAPRSREPQLDAVEPMTTRDRRAVERAVANWPHLNELAAT